MNEDVLENILGRFLTVEHPVGNREEYSGESFVKLLKTAAITLTDLSQEFDFGLEFLSQDQIPQAKAGSGVNSPASGRSAQACLLSRRSRSVLPNEPAT